MVKNLDIKIAIKKLLLMVFLMICLGKLHAQHTYQNGYFVTNDNERTECLIKNEDWDENPYSFKYKQSLDGEVFEVGIDTVMCFEVGSVLKYIRKEVDMDMSPTEFGDFSYQKSPEYETKILFLKVLVEGEYSLYHYKGDKLSRFFIQPEGENITQLIYKEYYSGYTSVAKNFLFRGQLSACMQCDGSLRQQIMNMTYTKRDIIRLFKKYELCSNKSFKYYQVDRKGHTKLNFNMGVTISNINAVTTVSTGNFKNDNILGYSLGAEFEYYFPIKNNKLSFLIEPLIQIERSDFEVNRFNAEYSLNTVRLPIGLRYYAYINSKNSFFFNSGLVFSGIINSGIDFYNKTVDNESSSIAYELEFAKMTYGIFSGLGYRFNDMLLELRYYGINQDLLSGHDAWNIRHNSFLLKASYTLDLGKKQGM